MQFSRIENGDLMIRVLFPILISICFINPVVVHASETVYSKYPIKILKSASFESAVVDNLEKGEKLQIIEQSDDWVMVENDKGLTGWAAKKWLSTKPVPKELKKKKKKASAKRKDSPSKIPFDAWRYVKSKDKFNDEEFSFAISKNVNYQYNNDFIIKFFCIRGKVRFEISADTLIASKGEPFTFIYRVDNKPAQTIEMKTFSNNARGGFYNDAEKVAKDIFGGSSIFVRAITWNNDFLEAKIPLTLSDKNIKKVFSDCGISFSESAPKSEKQYTFSQFKDDFGKLSVKRQEEILSMLQKMLRSE